MEEDGDFHVKIFEEEIRSSLPPNLIPPT